MNCTKHIKIRFGRSKGFVRKCMNVPTRGSDPSRCYLHGGGKVIHDKNRVDYILNHSSIFFEDRSQIDRHMKIDGWK